MCVIPPTFFPGRRHFELKIFRMTCLQCGFEKKYELKKDYIKFRPSDSSNDDDPELVDELPKVCPKCGAKLRKERIPIKMRF